MKANRYSHIVGRPHRRDDGYFSQRKTQKTFNIPHAYLAWVRGRSTTEEPIGHHDFIEEIEHRNAMLKKQ